ncbi:divalent metal cation transporter [Nonomuraea sp. M3C6]|uniref:Divalent metal cation transporter n=1 Tax=Nonomuraea marmarensis TaxID=3351344 RepID=A0ABW7AV00_9ACTN
MQGELVAMATDVAEFVGASVGLHLPFGMSPQVAGVITGAIAFTLLSLQRRGFKSFELAVTLLLVAVTGAFVFQVLEVDGQSPAAAVAGLVPGIQEPTRRLSSWPWWARPSGRTRSICTPPRPRVESGRAARPSVGSCALHPDGLPDRAEHGPGSSTCPCCPSPRP